MRSVSGALFRCMSDSLLALTGPTQCGSRGVSLQQRSHHENTGCDCPAGYIEVLDAVVERAVSAQECELDLIRLQNRGGDTGGFAASHGYTRRPPRRYLGLLLRHARAVIHLVAQTLLAHRHEIEMQGTLCVVQHSSAAAVVKQRCELNTWVVAQRPCEAGFHVDEQV